MRSPGRLAAVVVFVALLASNAYFWHARDWNGASRLMLTYALVDRGTLAIDGLEDQTRDRARIGRRFYSDKLPGFSLLAAPVYGVEKAVLGLPDHPLNRRGFTHWPADYGITLGTSGLATALTGALLTLLAGGLGCGPRRAALIGLAYGWATPAYVYATLAYGHQVTACALLGAFALIRAAPGRARPAPLAGGAGLLAALAATVELQVGPVSAILGLYLLALVAGRRLPGRCVGAFALGALGPTLVLLTYNVLAFGGPLEMGYFHEDIAQFRAVHSAENPLGLRPPDWSKALPLIWGRYRGLLFYAPILILAPAGWYVLAACRRWGTFAVSLAACLAVFLVNLSYPEWTGGWSTGPRLLLPLIPFAMLPVAAAVAVGGRAVTALAVALAVAGGVLMLLFQGAGGRVPQDVADPLLGYVLPIWRADPALARIGQGFARNLVSLLFPRFVAGLSPEFRWIQWVPLVAFQVLVFFGVAFGLGGRHRPAPGEPPPRDPGVTPPGG